MQDLATGHFHVVLDEQDAIDAKAVQRIVLCSGKVYYDLLERRRADSASSAALVRIEQLYPFPAEDYQAAIARYPNARQVVWCQEEPQNQGAWYQIRHRLQAGLRPGQELLYAGRASAAAPATGLHALHQREQDGLVAAALYSSETDRAHRETQRLTAAATRKGS
jgi:2-oxoglutarate dehydrogenase E1 component